MKYKITILFFGFIYLFSTNNFLVFSNNLPSISLNSKLEFKTSNSQDVKSNDSIASLKFDQIQSKVNELNEKVSFLNNENAFYHNQNKKLLAVIDNYDDQYYVFLTIGFIFIGIIAFVGILYWREKLRFRQKSDELVALKSENEFSMSLDRNLAEENAQLNEGLISKERELTALTMQLANIQDSVISILEKATLEFNDNKESKFFVFAKDIRSVFSQKEYWSEFMIKFTQIHPNFNSNIKEKYPVLSSKDISFCSLIKLNLSNKEIANLLQVSHESVITKKYLLKKKLALTADQDLFQVVNSID